MLPAASSEWTTHDAFQPLVTREVMLSGRYRAQPIERLGILVSSANTTAVDFGSP